jgi:hypothetical protein
MERIADQWHSRRRLYLRVRQDGHYYLQMLLDSADEGLQNRQVPLHNSLAQYLAGGIRSYKRNLWGVTVKPDTVVEQMKRLAEHHATHASSVRAILQHWERAGIIRRCCVYGNGGNNGKRGVAITFTRPVTMVRMKHERTPANVRIGPILTQVASSGREPGVGDLVACQGIGRVGLVELAQEQVLDGDLEKRTHLCYVRWLWAKQMALPTRLETWPEVNGDWVNRRRLCLLDHATLARYQQFRKKRIDCDEAAEVLSAKLTEQAKGERQWTPPHETH